MPVHKDFPDFLFVNAERGRGAERCALYPIGVYGKRFPTAKTNEKIKINQGGGNQFRPLSDLDAILAIPFTRAEP